MWSFQPSELILKWMNTDWSASRSKQFLWLSSTMAATFWKCGTSMGTASSHVAALSRKLEEAMNLLSDLTFIECVCKAANINQLFDKVQYSHNIFWWDCLFYVAILYIFWNINYKHFAGNFQVIFHTNSRRELGWWQIWALKINKKMFKEGRESLNLNKTDIAAK